MQVLKMRHTSMVVCTLIALCLVFMINISTTHDGNSGKAGGVMLAEARPQMSDILFLKGKFILKDKRGSIVIADDKKCHCPQHY